MLLLNKCKALVYLRARGEAKGDKKQTDRWGELATVEVYGA